ncbi:MAG TPA: hypothetical protein VK425_12015 [Acidimicrobiales bacterium]|nr:hypothetical protein [Acidimicrobiales bacterium]
MTTAVPAQPGGQPRHSASRRLDRRRRTVEKVVAALVLLAAFAVTVVLLGLQWLGNQGGASTAPVPGNALIREVQRS